MPASRSLAHRSPVIAASLTALAALAGACSGTPTAPVAPAASSAPPAVVSAAPSASSKPGAFCVIDGTVKGPDGAPVAGALVAAVAPSAGKEAAFVRSDAAGAFCFEGLSAGDYGLTVTSTAATSARVDAFSAGGDQGHAVEVRLGGEGFTLRGRITDDSGKSGGQRVVRITRSSGSGADLFVTESNGDGVYAVKLPPADYHASTETEDAIGQHQGIHLDNDLGADILLTRLNPRTKPPPDAVVAWLKQKAIPLTSVEAGHGFEDMEPLRAVVGEARVVALGEATRGTREFFQLKHRMLEFLVEKLGFRALVIEASFAETVAIDDYLRTGKGDPSGLVSSLGPWSWDTEEVVALVRWMRRYNQDGAHKEKLRFFGFDMQAPAGSVHALAGVLGKLDKRLWSEVAAALEPLDDDFSAERFGELPKVAQDTAQAAARRLVARFEQRLETDVKQLGAERWALMRMHARVLAQLVDRERNRGFDATARDRAMADNTRSLQEMLGPDSKLVLWAHNSHVSKGAPPAPRLMGRILSEKLGKDYVALGMAFDQGSFRAADSSKQRRGAMAFTVGAAPPGSLDGGLARVGMPLFAIDLRGATGAAAAWLGTATARRSVGSTFVAESADDYFHVSPTSEAFDALFFVAKTTEAQATANARASRRDDMPVLAAVTNGGFETTAAGKSPASWHLGGHPSNLKHRAKLVARKSLGGKLALQLDRAASPLATGVGRIAQKIDARPLRGKRVRVSAKVKLDAKGIGDEAFVFVTVDGPRALTASAPAPVSKAFRDVATELEVPADAESLTLGVALTGAAKATVDDVAVAPVEPTK